MISPANSILISAGEASGDQLGASLIQSAKELNPTIQFFGMGGSSLRQNGMETTVDCEHSASVMGVSELGGSIRKLITAYRSLVATAEMRRPSLAVLIDFPDFNFLLMRALKKRGIPVVYLSPPQLWAWRGGRLKTIKRYADFVIPIFPFEETLYRDAGIPAKFVGHPFADRALPEFSREEFLRHLGIDSRDTIVALLPGSRRSEVGKLLFPMLEGFSQLRMEDASLRGVIPVAPSINFDDVQEIIRPFEGVVAVRGFSAEVLRSARLGVLASGTATVEAALCHLPSVVLYKLSPVTYRLARFLVKGVSYFAMPNIIADKRILPELLQDEVSGERIACELSTLLRNDRAYLQAKEDLSRVALQLAPQQVNGQPASSQVAAMILSMAWEKWLTKSTGVTRLIETEFR